MLLNYFLLVRRLIPKTLVNMFRTKVLIIDNINEVRLHLNKTSSIVPRKHTGLYCDVIIITDPNSPKIENIRKDFLNAFKEEGLRITVSPVSNYINYFDITLHNEQLC